MDELLSLRVAVVSPSAEYHDLCRQAASALSVPVEFVAADEAKSAVRCIADGIDVLYIDSDFFSPPLSDRAEDRDRSARGARPRPQIKAIMFI